MLLERHFLSQDIKLAHGIKTRPHIYKETIKLPLLQRSLNREIIEAADAALIIINHIHISRRVSFFPLSRAEPLAACQSATIIYASCACHVLSLSLSLISYRVPPYWQGFILPEQFGKYKCTLRRETRAVRSLDRAANLYYIYIYIQMLINFVSWRYISIILLLLLLLFVGEEKEFILLWRSSL